MTNAIDSAYHIGNARQVWADSRLPSSFSRVLCDKILIIRNTLLFIVLRIMEIELNRAAGSPKVDRYSVLHKERRARSGHGISKENHAREESQTASEVTPFVGPPT